MKSELLRKALMSKMAVGGNVGNGGDDDAKKSAKKVTKIPEGYEAVKDSQGKPVTNEQGDVLYKKESKTEEPKKGSEIPVKPRPTKPQVKGQISDDKPKPTFTPPKKRHKKTNGLHYGEEKEDGQEQRKVCRLFMTSQEKECFMNQ